MFLLVRSLLKLGNSMINKSFCLSQSIPSIFVLLHFVSNYCFVKFNSVVIHASLVSDIVSLECHLCNLNPPCQNNLMESDINFLTSFILSSPVNKSSAYISSLTFSATSLNSCPQLSK